MASHMGSAYLRYSFTKGTEQEADFLMDVLALEPGQRILDVGCGPGRHSHALRRRGLRVIGVDISDAFVNLAASRVQAMSDERSNGPGVARFVLGDARALPIRPGSMDAAICLCQGGFGLLGGGEDEAEVLAQIARSLKPNGPLALSAFSSYFAVRYLEESDCFDALSGVNREVTMLRSPEGDETSFELWTTCFTPRELHLMCQAVGLVASAVWSVGPGDYSSRPADLDHPEWLVVARKL